LDALVHLARKLNFALSFPALLSSEVGKRVHQSRAAARPRESFEEYAIPFITSGVTPSGGYSGTWCRDASFILEAWIELGLIDEAARVAEHIWSNRISNGNEGSILVGRGSPEEEFRARVARKEELEEIKGALPTSIHRGYREIYAAKPDIDSNALMIRATCRACVASKNRTFSEKMYPTLQSAVEYLRSRDVDGDGLLEQGPNEDWMDTVMREGKVVYSQGTWLGALNSLASLLDFLGRTSESDKIKEEAVSVERNVDNTLWNDLCYADNASVGRINQDVVFYINERSGKQDPKALRSLGTIRERLWMCSSGPKVSSPAYRKTGPLKLKEIEYHNQAFWPWISAVEVKSRIASGDTSNAAVLLENCIESAPYEWIGARNSGRYPFRTGVASTFIALRQSFS